MAISEFTPQTDSNSLGYQTRQSAHSTLSFVDEPVTLHNEGEENQNTPQPSCLREVPDFLNGLMDDISGYEQRITQMTEKAMSVNLEQTLIALTHHNLLLKRLLEATAKELDFIVDGTHDGGEIPAASYQARKVDNNTKSIVRVGYKSTSSSEEYKIPAGSDSQEPIKSKSLGNTRNPINVGFAEHRTASAFDVESSHSSLPALHSRSKRNVEKFYETIEKIRIMGPNFFDNSLTMFTLAGNPMSRTLAEQSAKSFREQLEKSETNKKIEEKCTSDNIEKIMSKMRQFPYDTDILVDCIRSIRRMGVSELACRKIMETANCLEHLSMLFLFRRAEQTPTERSEFIILDIFCVDALCNVLLNSSNTEWNLQMPRQELEEKIKKGMVKWTIDTLTPKYQVPSIAEHLERIRNYYCAIAHFSLWLVVHHTVIGRQESVSDIRDVLIHVVTSEKFDEPMKKLATIALRKFSSIDSH